MRLIEKINFTPAEIKSTEDFITQNLPIASLDEAKGFTGKLQKLFGLTVDIHVNFDTHSVKSRKIKKRTFTKASVLRVLICSVFHLNKRTKKEIDRVSRSWLTRFRVDRCIKKLNFSYEKLVFANTFFLSKPEIRNMSFNFSNSPSIMNYLKVLDYSLERRIENKPKEDRAPSIFAVERKKATITQLSHLVEMICSFLQCLPEIKYELLAACVDFSEQFDLQHVRGATKSLQLLLSDIGVLNVSSQKREETLFKMRRILNPNISSESELKSSPTKEFVVQRKAKNLTARSQISIRDENDDLTQEGLSSLIFHKIL